MAGATLLWLRNDLRLADNPALEEAIARGAPVVPLFVWHPDESGPWAPGAASRVWLHHSLTALAQALRERGSRLVVRVGDPARVVEQVARESGASAVTWNRRYEPTDVARDSALKARLRESGLEAHSHAAALLLEPHEVRTGKGEPYRVFTPYWKACLALPEPRAPLPEPAVIPTPARWPAGETVEALGLLPTIDWAGGIRRAWTPGRTGALEALDQFGYGALAAYADGRDRPAAPGVSHLSPHLHFGELSPREVWHAVRAAGRPAGDPFLRQLTWRDFAHHLLFHFPRTVESPMDPRFERFPWARDDDALEAWQAGRTGYPLVDAGMRQLWLTGWMHNRVRMVVASFLVKHLLVHWLAGARWFWDTLVDADLANNTMGWQWVAGCGADAAPYFRIFNPVAQGERFDPAGAYVGRWLPEIAKLPAKWLHKPWQAPASVLSHAGVRLGESYPNPIVDHTAARQRALAALDAIKG
jgi:deoxyribodipyrimidine photo-lyase